MAFIPSLNLQYKKKNENLFITWNIILLISYKISHYLFCAGMISRSLATKIEIYLFCSTLKINTYTHSVQFSIPCHDHLCGLSNLPRNFSQFGYEMNPTITRIYKANTVIYCVVAVFHWLPVCVYKTVDNLIRSLTYFIKNLNCRNLNCLNLVCHVTIILLNCLNISNSLTKNIEW